MKEVLVFICKSTVFIAALFIIARTQKQPRCPSTEEWIKKVWYIDTMEHYSAIRKERDHEIHRYMDGTRKIFILNKVSQTQKDKYGICLVVANCW